MVRDPVRIVGPNVGDAEPSDQELGELEDPWAELLDLLREMRVFGQVGGHGIQLAYHAHAGARRCDDGVVPVEDLDEAPHQRDGLALVAGVEVHLAAARLGEGKVHLHPEAFQDLHGGPARLREERIVEASYKERHAHLCIPSSVSANNMIAYLGPPAPENARARDVRVNGVPESFGGARWLPDGLTPRRQNRDGRVSRNSGR